MVNNNCTNRNNDNESLLGVISSTSNTIKRTQSPFSPCMNTSSTSLLEFNASCKSGGGGSGNSSNDGNRLLPSDYVLGPDDVICGRGSRCFSHEGNVKFRKLIADNLDQYMNAQGNKSRKTTIICEMVDIVRRNSPLGGFVKRINKENNQYIEVGDFIAREKVSQAFRDALHDQYKSSNANKKSNRILKQQLQQQDHDQQEGRSHLKKAIQSSKKSKKNILRPSVVSVVSHDSSTRSSKSEDSRSSLTTAGTTTSTTDADENVMIDQRNRQDLIKNNDQRYYDQNGCWPTNTGISNSHYNQEVNTDLGGESLILLPPPSSLLFSRSSSPSYNNSHHHHGNNNDPYHHHHHHHHHRSTEGIGNQYNTNSMMDDLNNDTNNSRNRDLWDMYAESNHFLNDYSELGLSLSNRSLSLSDRRRLSICSTSSAGQFSTSSLIREFRSIQEQLLYTNQNQNRNNTTTTTDSNNSNISFSFQNNNNRGNMMNYQYLHLGRNSINNLMHQTSPIMHQQQLKYNNKNNNNYQPSLRNNYRGFI